MAVKLRGASGALAKAEAALRAHALAKPEATEHFPWGERAIKVSGKVFLFMYADATRLSLSTKLPASSGVALMLPFAKPTGYGLGKAGWVSASFERADQPPLEMLCAWIDESYQAVAPAKLAAVARGATPAATPTKSAKRLGTTKPAKRPGATLPTQPAKRLGTSQPARRPGTSQPARRPGTSQPARRPGTSQPAKRPG